MKSTVINKCHLDYCKEVEIYSSPLKFPKNQISEATKKNNHFPKPQFLYKEINVDWDFDAWEKKSSF